MTPDPIPTDRIMRVREVAAALGVSRATIYRYVDKGYIEPPLQIGSNAIGWRESYVMNYIAELQPVERV